MQTPTDPLGIPLGLTPKQYATNVLAEQIEVMRTHNRALATEAPGATAEESIKLALTIQDFVSSYLAMHEQARLEVLKTWQTMHQQPQ